MELHVNRTAHVSSCSVLLLHSVAIQLNVVSAYCDVVVVDVTAAERFVMSMQDGGRLDQLHPADAKRLCDNVQHSLRVVDANISMLHADVEMLREGRYSHVDVLQHRSVTALSVCESVSGSDDGFSG